MEVSFDENMSETPQEFVERTKIPIQNILLLSRALTHRSFLNEHPDALEDNERLEFLGDAVLDFVVGAWLYNHFPEMPEGDLTRMRSALVHTAQLATFARLINLGAALRLGKGEIQAGGRNRDTLLCDTFEAVIGAIYLDKGISAVQSFIDPYLSSASEDILENHKNEDPKSMLQEWAQSQGFSAPMYITRSASGPDHFKVFEVDVYINGKKFGTGSGQSKQMAEKQAARDILVKLMLMK